MVKNKHDKQKRAWGGAIKRTKPSQGAILVEESIRKAIKLGVCPAEPRILDFGCGHGFDAKHFGWDAYDPYYGPYSIEGQYDFVICTNVLNALSRNNRGKVISKVGSLLRDKQDPSHQDSVAYFVVPRNIPKTGKLGIHHSLQNYVVLSLPEFHSEADAFVIYQYRKGDSYKDKTKEFLTNRDKRAQK